jgi:hypothetical protein
MTPIKIISGGQTGADISGLRAAKRFGLETGGWMPKGWITEAGPRPEYRELYGMKECQRPTGEQGSIKDWAWEAACYRERTKDNIKASDLTIVFDCSRGEGYRDLSRGTHLVLNATAKAGVQPWLIRVDLSARPEPNRPQAVRDWLALRNPKTINIAGNRESKAPGIGAWVEAYLCEVFRLMGFTEEGVSK